MITLMTINTIELSSECNLACRYCINGLMGNHDREQGIMTDEVFDRALYWVKELVDQGTQREVNLNGNGESTLDPKLPERAARLIDLIGPQMVSFCTNGVSMTPQLAKDLKSAGLRRIDLSIHNAYYTRRAADIFMAHDIFGCVNTGAVLAPHNWAGQLPEENSVRFVKPIQCDPLIEGRGYVQSEGTLSPCCYDYRGLGTFGTVFDEDLLSKEIKPYALCHRCHQQIPQEIQDACNYHQHDRNK